MYSASSTRYFPFHTHATWLQTCPKLNLRFFSPLFPHLYHLSQPTILPTHATWLQKKASAVCIVKHLRAHPPRYQAPKDREPRTKRPACTFWAHLLVRLMCASVSHVQLAQLISSFPHCNQNANQFQTNRRQIKGSPYYTCIRPSLL